MKAASKRHLVLKVRHIGLIYYGLRALQKEDNTVTDRDIDNAMKDIRFQTGIDEDTLRRSVFGDITRLRLEKRIASH